MSFTIRGSYRRDGEVVDWAETFTCILEAPAGVLDDMARSVTVDARGRRQYNAPSLVRFLTGVLPEEEADRFDELEAPP